ncbi:carbon-nitrogen hydrolase family protein [Pseudomonas shirazensis]
MKLCAVQLAALKGDLAGNLRRHLYCIEQAARAGAQLVVFPELSLSGYEPALAQALAQTADSVWLEPVQTLCDQLGVSVALGLPLQAASGVQIGMPILRPAKPALVYAKQRLHADEMEFFTAGDNPLVFTAGELRVAPAICYESMFVEHAMQAREDGAGVYLVSVAKSAKGIREGFAHYPAVASRLSMPVLLANCVGPADNFTGAGCSAAWDSQGRLLAALDEHSEGLIMLDTTSASAAVIELAELCGGR